MLQATIKSLILAGLLVAALPLNAPAADKPAAKAAKPAPLATVVRQEAETAVAVRAQTQKMTEEFTTKRSELLDNIDAVSTELQSVTAQRKKTEAYLAGQKAKVAEINSRLAEIARLKIELEPLLDNSLGRLTEFVAADLPFLAGERRARLTSLGEALNDYDQGLGPKTRRMLEALILETRYGHGVEVTEGEIHADGGSLRVRLIRLGRLAVFALASDGRRAWRLDPATGKYAALDGGDRDLATLADIAERKRVVSLVEVPLGKGPQKGVTK